MVCSARLIGDIPAGVQFGFERKQALVKMFRTMFIRPKRVSGKHGLCFCAKRKPTKQSAGCFMGFLTGAGDPIRTDDLLITSEPVSWWTDSLFPALAPQSVVAFADIAAVVVSCLMIMSFSGKIRNRKNKKLYVVMLGGYNIILTCTFVHRTLAVLWK